MLNNQDKLRVVLADDNPSALGLFVSALGAEFDIVAAVSDGASALEAIIEQEPDVAVLDIEMPAMNGIEIARELRKRTSKVHIVLCTAYSDAQLMETAAAAGVHGYVIKSDGYRELHRAIRSVAKGGRHFPDLVARPPSSSTI